MLDRAYQPLTLDPSKLIIGIGSLDINGVNMGALKDTSLEVTSVVKERYAGYPAQRMESTIESVQGIIKGTAEEIGAAPVISLLENMFNNLEIQVSTVYNIEICAPVVDGTNITLTAKTQLLPELSINWQDDWSNVGFKFECVSENSMSLVTRGTAARPMKPATTVDVTKLSIGKPKVLIGGISVGSIQSLQLNLTGQVKKVEKGYPRCTSFISYLDSRVDLSIVSEEKFLTGKDINVEVQQAIVDGTYLSFTFPHCLVTDDLSFTPGNDWVGYGQKIMPFRTDTSRIVEFAVITP